MAAAPREAPNDQSYGRSDAKRGFIRPSVPVRGRPSSIPAFALTLDQLDHQVGGRYPCVDILPAEDC